jgi:hypothetical protein
MFSRSITEDSKSIIDDSRIMIQLVAPFTIVIYVFIVQATSVAGVIIFSISLRQFSNTSFVMSN